MGYVSSMGSSERFQATVTAWIDMHNSFHKTKYKMLYEGLWKDHVVINQIAFVFRLGELL